MAGLSSEEIVERAELTLESFPLISKHVFGNKPHRSLESAIEQCWPFLPPAVIAWLVDFVVPASWKSFSASACLHHVESLIEECLRAENVTGSWREKVARLRSRGASNFFDRLLNFGDFQSAVFELNLCLRLGRSGYKSKLASDQSGGPDITILDAQGNTVCRIEAYSPVTGKNASEDERIGLETIYRGVEEKWLTHIGHENLIGQLPQRQEMAAEKIIVDVGALPGALSTVVTEQKAKQLKVQGSILAVRMFGLVKTHSQLLAHMMLLDRDRWTSDVFACLPESCLGFLLCWLPEVTDGDEAMTFDPSPKSRVGDTVREFFARTGVMYNEAEFEFPVISRERST